MCSGEEKTDDLPLFAHEVDDSSSLLEIVPPESVDDEAVYRPPSVPVLSYAVDLAAVPFVKVVFREKNEPPPRTDLISSS